jgi:hypothetical protein
VCVIGHVGDPGVDGIVAATFGVVRAERCAVHRVRVLVPQLMAGLTAKHAAEIAQALEAGPEYTAVCHDSFPPGRAREISSSAMRLVVREEA